MKIGITGHRGFLGNYILGRLKANKKVSSVDGFDRPDDDLFDKESLKQFVKDKDVIIHLAALNRAEDMELLNVNLLGTFSLIEAIAEANQECRLVFASSFGVYGKSRKDDLIDEDFPAQPLSTYGFSKRFGEEMIAYKLKNYAILRISNIYGPGGRPFYNSVIATFVHLAKEGKPLTITGSGEQARDFVFVDDVVDAFEMASISKKTGVFNICSGEAISMNAIAAELKKGFPKLKVEHRKSDEEVIVTRGSYARANKAFGWKPKTRFEDGLARCWE
ncbi:NAD(P)-dependent oxidoreductase [Candidatus Woesearchaeota archaeon]|nr:NAD(P)-dependent oxidoreductase [Candidatus Woesearchaeota archaeon]